MFRQFKCESDGADQQQTLCCQNMFGVRMNSLDGAADGGQEGAGGPQPFMLYADTRT